MMKINARHSWLTVAAPAFDGDTYQLLDYARGQRLEQIGGVRIIRPDAQADGRPAAPEMWQGVNVHYRVHDKQWRVDQSLPQPWRVKTCGVEVDVRLMPSGHIGFFPENAHHWQSIVRAQPKTLLNLFAFTGVASVVALKQGAQVTHIDGAKPMIAAVRDMATRQCGSTDGLKSIAEDVRVYVARMYKQKKTFDAILLDPPPRGHGPEKKGAFIFDRDIDDLIDQCLSILSPQPRLFVLNAYRCPLPSDAWLHDLAAALQRRGLSTIKAQQLALKPQVGDARKLVTGWFVSAER